MSASHDSRLKSQIETTRRPAGRARGNQRWRSLLFLHWAVPADTLRPLVPGQLELDLYDGVAYVGVVPFVMRDIRPSWWPGGWGLNFLETNVRTYVIHKDRPGVFFFSLDASSRLAVWTARSFWKLPYFFAAMRIESGEHQIRYESRRHHAEARLEVECEPGEMLGASPPETIEYFLLERYILFVSRGEQIYSGQVHHAPYPAQLARANRVQSSLLSACGLTDPNRPPDHVHFSGGVDVEVFPLTSPAE